MENITENTLNQPVENIANKRSKLFEKLSEQLWKKLWKTLPETPSKHCQKPFENATVNIYKYLPVLKIENVLN